MLVVRFDQILGAVTLYSDIRLQTNECMCDTLCIIFHQYSLIGIKLVFVEIVPYAQLNS